MDVEKVQNQPKSEGRRRKKLLFSKVCEQMEFYFSDANLSKDRYLSQLIQSDPFVELKEFLRFNKILAMVSSVEDIAKALRKSAMLELSDDGLKVCRKTPVEAKENEDERTVYVENLSPETTHEDLKKVFSEFGKVLYVSIPKYSSSRAIKGFAFVEFDTAEEAMKTVEIFREKGSCLSSQMLPEKLCSIRTFEDQNTDEAKSRKVTFKIENDPQQETNSEVDTVCPFKEVNIKVESDLQQETNTQFDAACPFKEINIKMEPKIDMKSEVSLPKPQCKRNEEEQSEWDKSRISNEKLKRKKLSCENSHKDGGNELEHTGKKRRRVDSDHSLEDVTGPSTTGQENIVDDALKPVLCIESISTKQEEKHESDSEGKRKKGGKKEGKKRVCEELSEGKNTHENSSVKIIPVIKDEVVKGVSTSFAGNIEENISHQYDNTESAAENEDLVVENKSKKNRKKKAKSKKDKKLFALGMHILPKKEWKRLRNKYLTMQRSNMKKVKQQLAEAYYSRSGWYSTQQQYQEPTEVAQSDSSVSKARVSFTPSVIIRVGFNGPIADVKSFKVEARSQPSVEYVDINEGACEAFLRCSTASDAQRLIQSKPWEHMSLVQGNDENAYWEKIYKDREEKLCNKRMPKKQRGREKLIHRAETMLATHLHFDT